ncbi:MAG: disulfide reductase [Candidatus Lokiarchaeota archaeon]|nr:disulfide reductase [Candidatus Lokiarchaeota archaeon]
MPTDREEHISEKAKEQVEIKPAKLIDISDLHPYNQESLIVSLDHCIKCNTCKYAFGAFTPSCPSGEEFGWEAYWASGRIRLARALLTGKLEWNDEILHPIFACITCGSCQDQCQAVHNDRIVDVIEALRELAVKRLGAPENQKKMEDRVGKDFNPYGDANSTNEELKKKYNLPNNAKVVYFIGCTSNYRQKNLRNATLSVFNKLGIDFTLVDEHCCGSPLIRTGQTDLIPDLMDHNIRVIKEAGAETVVTSCAGCYRTLKKDFTKFGKDLGVRILHTSEFILPRLSVGMLKEMDKKVITYHDPCHLGHHLGFYDIPRQLINFIPNLEFIEMERIREASWCCGAGGGVKIGYPDLAISTAKKRIHEAEETKAEYLVSTCPFCKRNLSDANKKVGNPLKVIDLVEIVDELL